MSKSCSKGGTLWWISPLRLLRSHLVPAKRARKRRCIWYSIRQRRETLCIRPCSKWSTKIVPRLSKTSIISRNCGLKEPWQISLIWCCWIHMLREAFKISHNIQLCHGSSKTTKLRFSILRTQPFTETSRDLLARWIPKDFQISKWGMRRHHLVVTSFCMGRISAVQDMSSDFTLETTPSGWSSFSQASSTIPTECSKA